MPSAPTIWDDLPRNFGAGGLAGHRCGDGPVLLLIHGVGLRLEAWRAMIPTLAERFTVVAVDMPGHGASEQATTDTVAGFASAFTPILDTLEAPVFCAGHSMGAMIALELASTDERIAGVAALNAIYRRTEAAKTAVLARAKVLETGTAPDPTPTLVRWFGADPTGPDAAAQAACHRWLTAANPTGYAAAYHAFATHDGPTDAALRALDRPALFLTGAEEPNSTPAMSRAMADLAPLGQAHVVAGAAHMAPMTHGVEIARYLTSFFLRKEG